MQKPNKFLRAFTMIELSMVLVIISVLLITSIPVINSAVTNTKNKVTRNKINAIYQALGAYLTSHRRLPCPASMLLTKSNANYGKEAVCSDLNTTAATGRGIWRSSWNSNIIYGMVPVQELRLPSDMAEDGFGSKIAYIIVRGYAIADSFGKNYDSSTYDGNGTSYRIRIHEKMGTTYKEMSANVMLVILSHGANKSGAFPAIATSNTQVSKYSDEGYNAVIYNDTTLSSPAAYFYHYGGDGTAMWPILASSPNDSNFDDIVFYKTRDQMLADFKLFGLIKCQATNWTAYGTQLYLTEGSYGDVMPVTDISGNLLPCSSTSSNLGAAYATYRCGKFGTWGTALEECRVGDW